MNKKILKTPQTEKLINNVLNNMETITKNNVPIDPQKVKELSEKPSKIEKPEFLEMPQEFKDDHSGLSKEELMERLFQMIMHSNIVMFENEQLRTKLKEVNKILESKNDS